MKAISTTLMLALLAGTSACGEQAAAPAADNSLTATTNGTAAPIAGDSETANSATGKPAGGPGADPASVDGASEGPGPGDKPVGNGADPAGEQVPVGDKPQ